MSLVKQSKELGFHGGRYAFERSHWEKFSYLMEN
jgi:hypothetical protein